MRRKLSLHVRIMGIACLVLVTLCASLYYYYLNLEDYYVDQRVEFKTTYLGRMVGLLLESALLSNNFEPAKATLMEILRTDHELASFRLRFGSREAFLVNRNAALYSDRYFERTEPCRNSAGVEIARLSVGFWTRAYREEDSERLSVLNVIIALDLMVLVGLFLHLMLRELVTRPLEEFVDATKRVAGGDFSDLVPQATTGQEEERLAISFNDMVSKIRASREDLSRLNSDLEARVTMRTEELREAMLKMRQMDKLTSLGVLSAGVAHEINNPLSNIKMHAQLLAEDVAAGDTKDVPASVKAIVDQTDRAGSIVSKMLEFARQSPSHQELVPLEDVLTRSLDMVRYVLETAGVRVLLKVDPSLPPVQGSRQGLQQVFINLFSNAGHAMRAAGGTLDVTAKLVEGSIMIQVTDEGCGVDPEHMQRIFDPFFTTKGVGEGTGLGLSISFGIIRDHGGDLTVKSTPGRGTTFTVTLPPASPADPTQETAAEGRWS